MKQLLYISYILNLPPTKNYQCNLRDVTEKESERKTHTHRERERERESERQTETER